MNVDIRITKTPISITEVRQLASQQFGNLIKATVDVEQGVIALGGELHADEEQILLDADSKQKNLWGINLYPDKYGTKDFVEFDSMINLRPSQGNMSFSVEDEDIKCKIWDVICRIIIEKDAGKRAA